ncbi:ATP-binding protein [Accumulibacter sp.]|uniref:ATP-binding protein n=1 Tax=Accumulibacter sp. TaxID=2053492 RepID=UPI0025D1BBEC|nr:ATP-binding protein [Accumulibacter sp.]MCP5230185.1 PAS domain S-box protein [Accumulibacter sp.]
MTVSIRQGLLLFLMLASPLLASVVGLGLWGAWRSQEIVQRVFVEEVAPTQDLIRIDRQIARVRVRMYGVLNDDIGIEGARIYLAQARREIILGWQAYRAAIAGAADAEEQLLIATIAPAIDELPALLDRLDRFLASRDMRAINDLLKEDWWAVQLQVVTPIGKLIGLQEAHVATAHAEAQDVYRRTLLGAGLLLLLGLAMFVWFSRLLFAHVTEKLDVIENALMRIGRGDLDSRVGGSHRGEFGRIVVALDRVAEVLRSDRAAAEILRQRQSSILESMAEGLYGTDDTGRISYANAAAEQILGWSIDELLGRNPHQLFHHSHADGTPYPLAECLLDRARLRQEVYRSADECFWRKDGGSVRVELTAAPIIAGEQALGGVVVFRDISARKAAESQLHATVERLTELNHKLEEAQNQLLQSEKMASIGQLAAGVAHEINNPVGFVNSNLGSLRNAVRDLLRVLDAYALADPILADHPAVMGAISMARDAADLDYLRSDVGALIDESLEGLQRVRRIVQDLKDFSRVDTAEWHFADLEAGLDSTLNIVWNEIKYKAEVHKEYAGAPAVECIAAQVNQVLLNLLVNAAHAIDGRGTITLRTGFAADEVWVEVEDSGRGMTAEVLKRVFEPFFTTKPVGEGTGLGLSLAYGIAQRHGGRIEASSEPGVGSKFRLVLPVRQAQADAPASAAGGCQESAE